MENTFAFDRRKQGDDGPRIFPKNIWWLTSPKGLACTPRYIGDPVTGQNLALQHPWYDDEIADDPLVNEVT